MSLENIREAFSRVMALADVDFDLTPGAVDAMRSGNGAGSPSSQSSFTPGARENRAAATP
jgi:ABC-type uncharacterized transport system ATPase subunit